MIRKTEILTLTVLLAAHCGVALGQSTPATILTIDLNNFVEYRQDVSDPAKFASVPGVTTAATPLNFYTATMFADIIAVNGQPAKGLYVGRPRTVLATPTPTPGQAIADTTHNSFRDVYFEILKSDGTPIGSIVATGLSGGAAPPGAPQALQGSNWAIIGGTGAFIGVRGQAGSGSGNSPRGASISEDPANRRINGGGKAQFILQVIPMAVPQIVVTANGPAVVHSGDFSLITSSKPAAAGEILSLFATGLGPVTPGVDPGQPFPSSPLASVNSPVVVTVNGETAQVLGAVGYPGATDGYQVNFRVPSDTQKGSATVQVSAAWIAGTPATFQVQ
jgi:uncharacterized protein (TIGR03437 family)